MQRSILDQQAALLADQINHSAVMSRTLKRDFATMQEDEMTRQSAVEKMVGNIYSVQSTEINELTILSWHVQTSLSELITATFLHVYNKLVMTQCIW
jgi:hypothetical protein